MWFEKAKKRIGETEGDVALLVKNLNTGEVFPHREAEVFPAASIIKVPIMLALLDQAAQGKLDLNAPSPVAREDIVGGRGIIMHLSNLPYTLLDHAALMIGLSDNTAANKLIDTIGFAAINTKCAELCLADTVLGRKLMDFEALKQGKNNFTTCKDMLALFEFLHLNAEKYVLALDLLKRQQLNDLLSAFTRLKYEFAHKTGELDGVRHDVGILYLDAPVFVSFMSKNLKHDLEGVRLANDLGVLIVEAFS